MTFKLFTARVTVFEGRWSDVWAISLSKSAGHEYVSKHLVDVKRRDNKVQEMNRMIQIIYPVPDEIENFDVSIFSDSAHIKLVSECVLDYPTYEEAVSALQDPEGVVIVDHMIKSHFDHYKNCWTNGIA